MFIEILPDFHFDFKTKIFSFMLLKNFCLIFEKPLVVDLKVFDGENVLVGFGFEHFSRHFYEEPLWTLHLFAESINLDAELAGSGLDDRKTSFIAKQRRNAHHKSAMASTSQTTTSGDTKTSWKSNNSMLNMLYDNFKRWKSGKPPFFYTSVVCLLNLIFL